MKSRLARAHKAHRIKSGTRPTVRLRNRTFVCLSGNFFSIRWSREKLER
jgi:hypothetical protein